MSGAADEGTPDASSPAPLPAESLSDSGVTHPPLPAESLGDSSVTHPPLPAESLGDSAESEAAEVPGSATEEAESEWERRRRIAAAFGDVLPAQTSDDAGPRGGKDDDWYRDQVPPHHG